MRAPPESFRYEPDLSGRINGSSFYWRLPGDIRATDERFAAFSKSLWVQRDFAFDWDGMLDCLCDFDWVSDRKIVLVHDRLPRLPERDLKLYLVVLRNAVRWWRFEDPHELEVVFPTSLREEIEAILAAPAPDLPQES